MMVKRKMYFAEIKKQKKIKTREQILDTLSHLRKICPNIDEDTEKSFARGLCYGLLIYFFKESEYSKELSLKLIEKGWFLNNYMKFPTQGKSLEQFLSDDYQINILKENIKSIENLTIERFPKRKDIIQRAFWHHKSRDYISSIPLMIAQTDGIFRELTQTELFSKNKKRKVASRLPEFEDRINSFVLEPLKKDEYFGSNFEDALNFPEMISRNRILHGEDIEYYSEINSYKVISLLLYICSIVYDTFFEKKSKPSLTDLKDFFDELKSKI